MNISLYDITMALAGWIESGRKLLWLQGEVEGAFFFFWVAEKLGRNSHMVKFARPPKYVEGCRKACQFWCLPPGCQDDSALMFHHEGSLSSMVAFCVFWTLWFQPFVFHPHPLKIIPLSLLQLNDNSPRGGLIHRKKTKNQPVSTSISVLILRVKIT